MWCKTAYRLLSHVTVYEAWRSRSTGPSKHSEWISSKWLSKDLEWNLVLLGQISKGSTVYAWIEWFCICCIHPLSQLSLESRKQAFWCWEKSRNQTKSGSLPPKNQCKACIDLPKETLASHSPRKPSKTPSAEVFSSTNLSLSTTSVPYRMRTVRWSRSA